MSGIIINVRAGATFEESSVSATGQLVHVITDLERSSFGIGSDSNLKRAVNNYYGKEPNDAYVKSPTPWNDLYKTYGWPETKTVLEPIRAQILEVNTRPIILKTNTIKNESDFPAEFSTKIHASVTDSVSNTFTSSSMLSFQQTVSYNFKFLGIGAGGETAFGFDQEWGRSETHTTESTVGMETGVTVLLQPHQSAIVELSANSGTMKVRITYKARLTGYAAVNYNPAYKSHHFHGLPIANVLGGSYIQLVEDIDVGFYCNSTSTVKNADTKENMVFYYSDVPDEEPVES